MTFNDPNMTFNDRVKSVIAVAVEDLNIEMVKHLIEISKEAKLNLDFNSKDYWGNTPLHLVSTAPSRPLEYVSLGCLAR